MSLDAACDEITDEEDVNWSIFEENCKYVAYCSLMSMVIYQVLCVADNEQSEEECRPQGKRSILNSIVRYSTATLLVR